MTNRFIIFPFFAPEAHVVEIEFPRASAANEPAINVAPSTKQKVFC